MLDLGELAARVRVDDSEVPGGLTRTHRRFGQFHSQIESESAASGTRAGGRLSGGFASSVRAGLGRASAGVMSALGGATAVVTKFGTAGVAALGAVGAAGLGMGVKIAAGNENAQIAFTTMLGSGEKARAFLNDLQQFAAATPFDFPGLQTAASSLISAGVNAKNVIPIMTSLGNATSGMGTGAEGVQRATVALQQMNAAGRITAEDLNQLRDAGIPVYDLLAKATGKSKKEVAALAQTGKLGQKELTQMMDALASGKGLERFNGLMEKQSASLAGMWSTVKDNLGQGLARAVAPVIPLLKDGLGGAATFIQRSLAGLPPVLKGTVRFIRALGDEVGHFWAATRAREAAPLSAALHSIWRSLVLLFPALRSTKTAAGGVADAFPIMGWAIHQAVRGVELLARGLAWLADNQDVVRATARRLADRMGELWDKLRGPGGMRDVFAPIGKALGALWEQLRNIDAATVSRAFEAIGNAISQVGPMLTDFLNSLPAVQPTLHAIGVVLGFVADHVDLVGKALPYLIAGFAAYKAVQAANAVVGRESLVGFGLQLASTIALTASNFALAASQRAVDASEQTGILTRTKSVALTIAHGVATVATTAASLAASAASKAWAAAQWLLNVAMDANPIGLVVLAIAALVGGFIYAYKHSEKFRAIVDKTFSWIKENVPKALEAAWHGIKVAWDAITGAFSDAYRWVRGVFRRNWTTIRTVLLGPFGAAALAIYQHWDDIKGAFTSARRWVTGTFRRGWGAVTGVITGAVTAARNRVANAWDDVTGAFTSARRWVTGTFRRGWNAVRALVVNPIDAARDTLVGVWSSIRGRFSAVSSWVRGTFRRAWNAIKSVITNPIDSARDAVRVIFSDLRKRFSGFVTAAGHIWDGLKAKMKAPIVAVIGIINTGLIGAYNWVIDKLGIGSKLDPIQIKGFRRGGATDSAASDDEIVGAVHANEHVATAEEVRKGGGHATWEKARALARAGRLANVVNGLLPRGDVNAKPTDDELVPPPPLPTIPGLGDLNAIARKGPQGTGGEGAAGSSAVSRGEAMIGQMGWYRRCLAMVNAAWNHSVGRFRLATAKASQNAGPRTMDGRPPGGAGVYWDTGPSGHIALAVGDGTVVSTDAVKAGRIDRVAQTRLNAWGPYRGWWHPNGAAGGGGFDPGGGGGMVSVKAAWLGAFANPSEFFKDRAKTLMDKAGFGDLGTTGWQGVVRSAPGKLVDAAVQKIKQAPASAWHTITAAAGAAGSAIADVAVSGSNRARGLALLTAAGFNPASQWGPLNSLWTRESGWRTTARNPSSGAYGIPQALPGSKMASVGGDWRTNPNTQIRWGLGYIRDVYKNPAGAWAHSQRTGWYANGTPAAARGFGWTAEKAAELVLNPQLRNFDGGERVLNPRDTAAVLGGGGQQPYIGNLTLVSSGSVHRDLDEVMFRVRTASRGGVFSASR